ncbi:hypothetical protein ABIB66_003681 [Bradyrhizobium sp. F1.13.3]
MGWCVGQSRRFSVGRVRSLLVRVEIDTAQRAHKCQASSRHPIKKGDTRLNVRAGRGWDRYCMECARKIMEGSLAALTLVSQAVETRVAVSVGDDEAAPMQGDESLESE